MQKLYYLGFILILLGCSSSKLSSHYITNDHQETLEDLKLELGYDVYSIRADLVRRQYTETTTRRDGAGNTHKEETRKNADYMALGARIGNGIFLDLAGNVTVDIVEFFDLEQESIKLLQRFPKKSLLSFIEEKKSIEKQGNKINFAEYGSILGPKKMEVLMEGDVIKLGEDIQDPDAEIIIGHEKKYNMTVSGLLGKLISLSVEKNADNVIDFKKPLTIGMTLVQESPNKLLFMNRITIEKKGNEVIFTQKGLISDTKRTFKKIKNGFIYYDEDHHGIVAEKVGDIIYVRKGEEEIYALEISKI